MKRNSFFRNMAIGAFGCLGLMTAGCGSEKELPAAPAEEIELELSVSVLSPKGTTRASAPSFSLPDYPSENLNSLRVIIVDKETGTVSHNRAVVFKNGKPDSDDMLFKVKTSADYSIYLLGNCRFSEHDFGLDRIPVGSRYDAAAEGSIEKEILAASMSGVLFDNRFEDKTEIPLLERFDVATVAPTGDAVQRQPVNLFITRAAAKFSFSISTSDDFIAGASRKLTSIKISGLSDRQYLLPASTLYLPAKGESGIGALEGRDITSFSLPETAAVGDYIFTLPDPLALPTSGYEWNPEIYFAESLLPEKGFACSLSFDNGATWLPAATLPNLPYGLPRNTHAKVNITIGNDNAMFLDVVPMPWEQETVDFDFTDEIGLSSDGSLAFTAGTYQSLDKSTGRLVIKNQAVAKGTFGISTPMGGRWDAYLITQGGEPDAIRFRLADGSTTTHLSGTINGSKTEFQILSAEYPGSEANTAQLQVIVTTRDGRAIPVNILQGGGYGAGVSNLTIIQNPR